MRHDLGPMFDPSAESPATYTDLAVCSFAWLMAGFRNRDLIQTDIVVPALVATNNTYGSPYFVDNAKKVAELYNYFKAADAPFKLQEMAANFRWPEPYYMKNINKDQFYTLFNQGVYWFALRLQKTYWLAKHYAHIYSKQPNKTFNYSGVAEWVDPKEKSENPFIMTIYHMLMHYEINPWYGAFLTIAPKRQNLFFSNLEPQFWMKPIVADNKNIFTLKSYNFNEIPNKDWFINAASVD